MAPRNLSDLTPDQQEQFHILMERGYTFCLVLANGNLCPGYSDWKLETALDRLEREARTDRRSKRRSRRK